MNYRLLEVLNTAGRATKAFRKLDNRLQEISHGVFYEVQIDFRTQQLDGSFSHFVSQLGFDFESDTTVTVTCAEAIQAVQFIKYRGSNNTLLLDVLLDKVLNDEDNTQAVSLVNRVRVLLRTLGDLPLYDLTDSQEKAYDAVQFELEAIRKSLRGGK